MLRTGLLLLCCVAVFAGCSHRTSHIGAAEVASPSAEASQKAPDADVAAGKGHEQSGAENDNRRMLQTFRENRGQLRLTLESPAALTAPVIRQGLGHEFDALYFLLKAVPDSVLNVQVASASDATAQVESVTEFFTSDFNIERDRIHAEPSGVVLEKGALAVILISMPHNVAPEPLFAEPADSSLPVAASPPATTPANDSPVAAESDTLIFHFNSGRSGVPDELEQGIGAIAGRLMANPGARALIEGHTDNVGSKENNDLLSYQRALAVQIELIKQYGIAPDRMDVMGHGESQPVASNASANGRALNRRVVVRFSESPEPTTASLPETKEEALQRKSLRVADEAPTVAVEAENAPLDVASIPEARVSYRQLGPVSQTPRKFKVEISVSKCTLWLYEIMSDGSKRLVRPFQVATARRGTPWPSGSGYVTGIDYDPWWFPTQSMKQRAKQLGKRLVPTAPGAPDNPMGAVKIMLSHANDGGAYRIHGTNQPSMIGKRVSLGCIRMHNDDGIELARTIPVGTEVEIRF